MSAPLPFLPEAMEQARINVTLTVEMLRSVPPERVPSAEEIARMFSDRDNLSPEEHVTALCSTIGIMFRLLAGADQ